MSDLFVATITDRKADQPTGWVASMADGMTTAVVCRRDGDSWEPLYGVERTTKGASKFALPSCFLLAQEAVDALTAALKEEGEDHA